MELSEEKKKEYVKRLLLSRMRLLNNHGFFGLLLMHMRFGLTDSLTETACTNGVHIYFNPHFLGRLTDSELDFVMMHEILHVVHSRRPVAEGLQKNPGLTAADWSPLWPSTLIQLCNSIYREHINSCG